MIQEGARSMIKIVIVSDSHGNRDTLRYAIRQEQPFQMLIHAGDVEDDIDDILPPKYREYEVHCVRGNCDWGNQYPAQDLIAVKGDGWQRNIFVTHGHRYGVRSDDSALLHEARNQLADVAIYGHTHIPVCYEAQDGILVINPGSVTFPRQLDRKRTYAVLFIDDDGDMSAYYKPMPDRMAY